MIYFNDEVKTKLDKLNENNSYIVADFNKTITKATSCSSWSIFVRTKLLPDSYIAERNRLYNIYYPYEIDAKLDIKEKNRFLSEWWQKHLDLLVQYKLSEKIIDEAISHTDMIDWRDGAKDFLTELHKKGIPVIIVSGGLGDIIRRFLIKHNCLFDNIFIISNFFKFNSGVAIGTSGKVIQPFNKKDTVFPNEVKKAIKGRNKAIVLGDMVEDIDAVKTEYAISLAFLDDKVEENLEKFKKAFDIVCTDNTTFYQLKDFLKAIF